MINKDFDEFEYADNENDQKKLEDKEKIKKGVIKWKKIQIYKQSKEKQLS